MDWTYDDVLPLENYRLFLVCIALLHLSSGDGSADLDLRDGADGSSDGVGSISNGGHD